MISDKGKVVLMARALAHCIRIDENTKQIDVVERSSNANAVLEKVLEDLMVLFSSVGENVQECDGGTTIKRKISLPVPPSENKRPRLSEVPVGCSIEEIHQNNGKLYILI